MLNEKQKKVFDKALANSPWLFRPAMHAACVAACEAVLAMQQADLSGDTHQFQNFHRNLCERFGYVHDPIDWRRDQASLIEYIASEMKAASAMQPGAALSVTPLTDDEIAQIKKYVSTVVFWRGSKEDFVTDLIPWFNAVLAKRTSPAEAPTHKPCVRCGHTWLAHSSGGGSRSECTDCDCMAYFDPESAPFEFFRCMSCGYSGAITQEEIAKHRAQCAHGPTVAVDRPAPEAIPYVYPEAHAEASGLVQEMCSVFVNHKRKPDDADLRDMEKVLRLVLNTRDAEWERACVNCGEPVSRIKAIKAALLAPPKPPKPEVTASRFPDGKWRVWTGMTIRGEFTEEQDANDFADGLRARLKEQG